MLYQFVNKRAEILAIAICHHSSFRQVVNHVFALLNFVPSLIAEMEFWRTSLKSLNLASKPAILRNKLMSRNEMPQIYPIKNFNC